jgi:hypothetical protein
MANFFTSEDNHSGYPSIIYLDSFFEDNRRCIQLFKKYLFYEYAIKNNLMEESQLPSFILENSSKLRDFTPQVPKQNNTWDCGIYLLSYAELFFYDPKLLLQHLEDNDKNMKMWFDETFIVNKRRTIQKIMMHQEGIYNCTLKGKNCNITNIQSEAVNFPSEAYFNERAKILEMCYNNERILNTSLLYMHTESSPQQTQQLTQQIIQQQEVKEEENN